MFLGFRVAVNRAVCRRSLCTARMADDSMPLHGIRVLDLSRVIAGPMCTLALADLGAEIIKIEHPETGDFVRSWPPLVKDPQLSCTFVAMNRNKKSVGVDFKNTEGQVILKTLAQKCDVLLENYVPGVLAKYKLDYDSLKSVAPHLIYCSVTGYGSEGPYSRRSGVDLIAASMSGHLFLTGPADGEPCKPGTSSIDIMAGLWAHGAIVAALRKRDSTKRGCKIDVDLLSTGIAALAHVGGTYLNCGQQAQRRGTEHENVVPYKSFKTKDGYVTTGAINDSQFRQLSNFLGVPQLGDDERFSTAAKRVTNRQELLGIISPLFENRTTKEWCDLLDGTSLPHGPLNDLAAGTNAPILRLRCRKQKSEKSVRWNEGTVDNEHMNKKKSKCCCIYKKPKQRFDESSDSESDECANCFGHVEVKKDKQLQKLSQANNSCCGESSTSNPSDEITLDHAQPINSSGITMVSS